MLSGWSLQNVWARLSQKCRRDNFSEGWVRYLRFKKKAKWLIGMEWGEINKGL
jgi:hypothetical protein